MKNLLSTKVFSSNQLFSNVFSRNNTFTDFLPKKCESKFPLFPHCAFQLKEVAKESVVTKIFECDRVL